MMGLCVVQGRQVMCSVNQWDMGWWYKGNQSLCDICHPMLVYCNEDCGVGSEDETGVPRKRSG